MDISFEKTVSDTYSKIAKKFSNTRYKVWKSVRDFLDDQKDDSYVLEVGCGNGKNLRYNNKLKMIGVDNCKEFVNNVNTFYMNAIKLDFNSNIFDAVISIAVIHHLATDERRKKCVEEMIRVCKPNGNIMIEVWNRESNKYNKKNTTGDQYISFMNSDGKSYDRFYHFFEKDEFIDLIKQSYDNYILDGKIYEEKDNWIFIGKKIRI